MPEPTPTPPTAAEIKAKAKAERIAAASELKSKHDTLRLNVGKTFTDGERDGTVFAFEPSHDVRGNRGETFLVNFGNPNRSDYINAEEFLNEFKPKE